MHEPAEALQQVSIYLAKLFTFTYPELSPAMYVLHYYGLYTPIGTPSKVISRVLTYVGESVSVIIQPAGQLFRERKLKYRVSPRFSTGE